MNSFCSGSDHDDQMAQPQNAIYKGLTDNFIKFWWINLQRFDKSIYSFQGIIDKLLLINSQRFAGLMYKGFIDKFKKGFIDNFTNFWEINIQRFES